MNKHQAYYARQRMREQKAAKEKDKQTTDSFRMKADGKDAMQEEAARNLEKKRHERRNINDSRSSTNENGGSNEGCTIS